MAQVPVGEEPEMRGEADQVLCRASLLCGQGVHSVLAADEESTGVRFAARKSGSVDRGDKLARGGAVLTFAITRLR